MSEKISINRAILHIMDKTLGEPILSEALMDTNELGDYLERLTIGVFRDDEIKEFELSEARQSVGNSIRTVMSTPESFLDVSIEFARLFFENMNAFEDVPEGDLLVLNFTMEGQTYFGALKLNYRKSYIHYVNKDERIQNIIMCQPTSLQGPAQKTDEFIIFGLADGKILLKEKKYTYEGEPQAYIAKRILGLSEKKSSKENIRIVKNVMKKVAQKYHPDDFTVEMEASEAIAETFDSRGTLEVEQIAEKVARGVREIKEEFVEAVKSKGIEESVPITQNAERMVNKKHRILTEDGVELKLPSSIIRRKDKFEIINNPDGTISILIKNVEIAR